MANVLVSRVSKAGGLITGTGLRVLVATIPVCLEGDLVDSHGDSPHSNATMKLLGASGRIIHAGVPVCFDMDPATCGHLGTLGVPRIVEP